MKQRCRSAILPLLLLLLISTIDYSGADATTTFRPENSQTVQLLNGTVANSTNATCPSNSNAKQNAKDNLGVKIAFGVLK